MNTPGVWNCAIICLRVNLISSIVWVLSSSYNMQTHVLSLNFLELFYWWFSFFHFLSLFLEFLLCSCWTCSGPIIFFLFCLILIFHLFVFLLCCLGDFLNFIIQTFFEFFILLSYSFYSFSEHPFIPWMFLLKIKNILVS